MFSTTSSQRWRHALPYGAWLLRLPRGHTPVHAELGGAGLFGDDSLVCCEIFQIRQRLSEFVSDRACPWYRRPHMGIGPFWYPQMNGAENTQAKHTCRNARADRGKWPVTCL